MLSLREDRRSFWSSVFGIAVGISALVFFVSLGLGVARVVKEKVFPVDLNIVEVVPSSLSVGLLTAKLDENAFKRLQSLPGVEVAYRKMNVRVPAVSIYDGDFFGRRLRMGLEILAVGVDPGFVKADVQMGEFVDNPTGPIPSVAASRLIEIYNKSFAPARSLPQISKTMLTGFQFPVEFNKSFVVATPDGPVTSTLAQVVGISDRGLLAGITIPLETAKRLNKAGKADFETLTGVALKAQTPGLVPELVAAVKDMGFKVDDSERKLAENAGAAVAITTSALALLSVLICVLAAFNIAHALSAKVKAKQKQFGVMRAVGATTGDIFSLVFTESILLGLAGGILGTALAVAATLAGDALALKVLPEFPFKPDSFFLVPWWLPVVGVALGILSAVAGSIIPARGASQVDPVKALTGA
jgi:putative ABC transport system permease protein